AEAAPALEYLVGRGITRDSIRRFQLGFAPDQWEWITAQVRGTAFNPAMLERIGVVSRRRQGPGYYDRFKGRVLFPIFDSQGRAAGLGGRVLPQLATSEMAKYINSPETPLFSKSNLLYGLNIARDAIRKTATALVMEGYTDCIVAHQAGFENTVAVLGTALGASHIQLLRRYAERIRVVLVLDGDEAGRRRAKEVLELFVAANVDLRVLTLPHEMDPAEFLLQYGAKAFDELVAGAVDALAHACRSRTAGIDLKTDVPGAMQALEEIVGIIAKAPRLRADTLVEDRLREEKILKRLAVDFQVPEEQVRKLMTENRRKTALRSSVVATATASTRAAIDPLERELFEILLQFPAMIEQIGGVIEPAQLTSEPCRRVLAQCLRLWSERILPDFERLLLENDDPGVKNLLVELDENARAKAGSESDIRLRDVLAGFERRQQQQWARGRTAALKQGQLPEEEQLTVLQRLEQQQRARQQHDERTRAGISEPTDG
ncbi:MAG TPA: toprim domain-containing protein, partial [Pirellulales bacterium]|nr:toprim domain-containing protein [Pirellulales bacterium]